MKKLKPEDLVRLAQEKKSVSIPFFEIRMPAAFLISMQFRLVMLYLASGCYEYQPKKKTEHRIGGGTVIKSDF